MVEANDQPQDKIETPGGEDFIEGAIQMFEKQFGKVDALVSQRIDKLVAFKEVASKKAISFLQEIEDFKETFNALVAQEQANLKNLPVFKKGVEFYHAQLNFNFVNILKELEGEIQIAKEHKNVNLKRKEAKLKELLGVFDFENFQSSELGL